MSLIESQEKKKKLKKRDKLEKSGDAENNTKKSKKRKSEDGENSSPVKKFHISLKMQKNDGPLSQEPASGQKKGPKIVIAKSKKSKDEEVKPHKKLNKRRKKKLEQGLPLEETVHETKGQAKAISYLKTWHTDRENWKFEKCRQIWLLHVSFLVFKCHYFS